ncbi:MAG: histidine phosphatase family protein [endosymbiont of Galathealinum brachiosum]|uniref:Histidine phosphatase family protein n=1 Tax=endosymbiont of Galathealinum brachiosum TaxID=2200906 RepID=A0A370D9L8_9GAMM|nr:MAG: histidine phosphatase family protein [endosymbiont of Galathealinum brachiosum]
MQKLTTIDLLRHGETTKGNCFLGSTDASLSKQGWEHMQLAVKGQLYQRIISSPLIRCADFSQTLAKENGLDLEIEDDLREIDFGDWEGLTAEDLWRTDQEKLSMFWEDPESNTPPNAEGFSDFKSRVNSAFEHVANKHKNEHILLVVHGGVIRQIISEILSITFKKSQKINIDYAGLTRVTSYDGNLSLHFINQQVNKL